MIYPAINPVVGTILIIFLHEKSDKYITLFLHCRFCVSLSQVAGYFFYYPVNTALERRMIHNKVGNGIDNFLK